MPKFVTLILLIAWLPSGCAAAREQDSAAERAAFCWPLKDFRYSLGSATGGWQAARGRGASHLGVDMFAPVGTTVQAIADGTVYDISTGGWGWGNVAVMVKHRLADGRWFIALYGHIRNSNGLRKGSRVHACASIGTVGSYSCGSHLHFGVIAPGKLPHAPYGTSKRGDHNNFIDPLQFLRDSQPGSMAEAAAQHPAASATTASLAVDKATATDSEKKVGDMAMAEAAAQVPVLSAETDSLAADESVSVSPAKKQQSRRQVRSIRSKNKKQAAASKTGRSRSKKAAAKKSVQQKSKRSRSAAGKVRSLTGSSKRSVSARGRR